MLSWLFCGYGGYGGMMSPGLYGGISTPPLREPTERDRMVEARLHALELACAGLWELLKAKNGYTDEELIALIKQVDQQRGTQGPTLGSQASECPRCHHKMLTANHTKCLWCGADLGPGTPFPGS